MGILSVVKGLFDALPVNNKVVSSSIGGSIMQIAIYGLGLAGVVVPGPWQPILIIAGGAIIGHFTPSSVQDCAKDLLIKASDLKAILPEIQASYPKNPNEVISSTQAWKKKDA